MNKPAWNEKQQRFLAACEEERCIARAARRAGVHPSSVYRWRTDPAFQAAMRAAFAIWHRGHLARYYRMEAEREQWRQEREAARRPMRLKVLEATSAAKRRKYGR